MSAVRFTVTKAEDESPIGESTTDGPNYGTTAAGDDVPQVRIVDTEGKFGSRGYVIIPGENKMSKESDTLMDAPDGDMEAGDKHMALYEDEFARRPMISRFLSNMANYDGGVEPNIEQLKGDEDESKKKAKASKLGTVLGVYFPCLQNIFGVILFIRLVWVVGQAGIVESFIIVFICSFTTLLTAISMSAIATNGVIPSGGSYFMISRSLGPEFGGAVGILFYLGTSFAGAMYIVGAIEILVKYIVPQILLFDDMQNTFRIYGTVLLILMVTCVLIGVKFVSKFSPVALACVLVSILAIYVGIFVANPSRGPQPCYVGNRIMRSSQYTLSDGTQLCTKNASGPLYASYCGNNTDTDDPDCEYFKSVDVSRKPGIPGLASGVITTNFLNKYLDTGDRIDATRDKNGEIEKGNESKGEIVADMAASFVIIIAIFFPSCTGIMAGSNRSGDLQDAQKSIPIGTIMAIFTTGFVYLSTVIFFGACIDEQVLRDKFGDSISGGLIIAYLAWPNPWVIMIGSFLSTVGAGLQSLTGAPRLLAAIASDGVIPFMNLFSKTTKGGEPIRAILLTALICECGVLIANVDLIAPIVTQFFLLCYGFVNLACTVQTLLHTPNWRPRFRFYHWTLSLFGVTLCVALMFISSWYYALICMAIAGAVYKYIEYKGAEKEWGDGIRGLAMSAARFALLRLEEAPPHVKNFRPQVLILMKLDEDLQPKYRKLFAFSSQLKAGKGLTLVTSVLAGHYSDRFADSQAARQSLAKAMKKEKVKGFADVLVTEDVVSGLGHAIQTAGVGGLRHNTIIVGWPAGWRKKANEEKPYRTFIDTIRYAAYGHLAVLIPKGIEQFPDNSEKMSGTIDIWWIVHDGGLLMLLPFLLTQHKTWGKCKMRIFTVAQMEDNSIQMKKDLQTFLYHLRFSAEVAIVELPDSDISAYTYERTLMMEQRTEMLKEIRIKQKDPQDIVDRAHKQSSTPTSPTSPPMSPTSPTSPTQVSVTVDTIKEEEDEEGSAEKTGIPNSLSVEQKISESNQYTFTPGSRPQADGAFKKNLLDIKPAAEPCAKRPDNKNVRRMHTAVRLNEVIVEKSHDAKLVILNLPGPPNNEAAEENYMEYLEVLTEGLERVVLVRGGGREVITMYS